jgi:hypothetical protein
MGPRLFAVRMAGGIGSCPATDLPVKFVADGVLLHVGIPYVCVQCCSTARGVQCTTEPVLH